MLLREAVGQSLRSLRIRQGRTLRDVADAAGVSLAHLSAIERGITEPSSEIIGALCRALGVELGDLLDDIRRHLLRAAGRRSQFGLAA